MASILPNNERWPATYLITGGAGFIGGHLATALLEQGHRVLTIDNLSTGRIENIRHLLPHRNFSFARASITDEVVLDRLASEADVIVHLAAAVGVKLIVEQPVHTIETNIMGTEILLRTAQRYQAKVLIASTSEVYGKGIAIPFNEDDDVVLGPTYRSRWAYAASKMVDEFLALAYYREKELPVVLFRLFNTVGPRQTGRYGMVVPRFVEQALRGEPLSVYGNGQQSRCFLHVSDAVRAIIALANCPEAVGQVFNVGAREAITIEGLARKVLATVDQWQASHPNSALRTSATSDNHDQRITYVPYEEAYAPGFEDMERREPDIAKIQRYTSWAPRRSLDDIVRDVIAQVAEER